MTAGLALLDASLGETPAERNVRREVDADVEVFKLSEGELPPPVSSGAWQFDAVVISGSQTSVYDDRDWIHETIDWVRRTHDAGVPMLGICWGHQLLAQALGGRVVDMGEHELGYRTVSRTEDDPLLEGVPEEFVSFETHSDRVAELPPGARTLARNDHGLQAFRLGMAWGVQFHPEYDRETAEWVVQNKELPEDRIATVREGFTDAAVAEAEEAKRLFRNFESIAAGDRRARHEP